MSCGSPIVCKYADDPLHPSQPAPARQKAGKHHNEQPPPGGFLVAVKEMTPDANRNNRIPM